MSEAIILLKNLLLICFRILGGHESDPPGFLLGRVSDLHLVRASVFLKEEH